MMTPSEEEEARYLLGYMLTILLVWKQERPSLFDEEDTEHLARAGRFLFPPAPEVEPYPKRREIRR